MLKRSLRLLNLSNHSEPRITVLESGLKICTFNEISPVSSIGLFTTAASRYEVDEFVRCSRILEKHALVEKVEGNASFLNVSNQIHITNFRERMCGRIDCLRWEIEEAMDVLVRMLVQPEITEQSIQSAREIALYQSIDSLKREPAKILFELLHQAAYGNKSLGRPCFTLNDNDYLNNITAETLQKFISTYVKPERIAVCAMGVEHDEMVKLVENKLDSIFKSSNWVSYPFPEGADEPAVYTGGATFEENLHAPQSYAKFEEDNRTLIGIMFEGVGRGHEDYHTMRVAQSMLGGGEAFETGGPGKGILTKLFREGLCRNGWLESAHCITSSNTDSGLFGVYGGASHEHNKNLANFLMYQLSTVPDRITEQIVLMAATQYLITTFMQYETREESVQQMGLELALTGKIETTKEIEAKVAQIDLKSIADFSAKHMSKPKTLSIYGNIEGLVPR